MKNRKTIINIIIEGILLVIIALLVVNNHNRIIYKDKIIYKDRKQKSVEDIKKYENIVFLGDSITEFYPVDDIYADLPIVRNGVGGYTTNNILEKMDSMVYQYNPTSVFLLIGTNDIAYSENKEEKEQIVENIKKIITSIKEHRKKAKIYLESIYPVNSLIDSKTVLNRDNQTIQEINEKLKAYCNDNDVIYIDIYKELIDEEGNFNKLYTTDGLHPNTLGYAKISRVRLTYIYGME